MDPSDTKQEAVSSFNPKECDDSNPDVASEPDAPLEPEAELHGVPDNMRSSLEWEAVAMPKTTF